MPRLRLRTLAYLATMLLIYHWLPKLIASSTLGLALFSGTSGASSSSNSNGAASGYNNQIHLTTKDAPSQAHDFSSPWTKRIVAVGDLHGDFANAMSVLRSAELVDHRGQWVGKDTTLVQTGDIVDRGRDTIALYRLMDTLRVEAELAGGQVISLLGNHEYMNAMGDWRYVTEDDIATFHGQNNRRKVMSSGWIGQTWQANYSVAARVAYGPESVLASDDDISAEDAEDRHPLSQSAVIAVHGGIHPSWANISHINSVGASLLSRCVSGGISTTFSLPPSTTAEERDFYSATGPLWFRGYALDDEADGVCEMAEVVLRRTRAKRMLMGHTPNFKGIVSRCRGKVIIIDTGISHAYGGVLSALEIVYSLRPASEAGNEPEAEGRWNIAGLFASKNRGKGKPRKLIEREEVTALYGKRREVLVRKERTVEL